MEPVANKMTWDFLSPLVCYLNYFNKNDKINSGQKFLNLEKIQSIKRIPDIVGTVTLESANNALLVKEIS